MKLEGNNHSVFLLHYHLIFVVKFRRKVIDDAVSARLKEIFNYIAPNYNITIEEWNSDKDHIHVLFKAHPNSALSKFINAYKSASSRLVKKSFLIFVNVCGKKCFGVSPFVYLPLAALQLKLSSSI